MSLLYKPYRIIKYISSIFLILSSPWQQAQYQQSIQGSLFLTDSLLSRNEAHEKIDSIRS